MKAAERYQLTLDQFRLVRQAGTEITLREFCNQKHVNYPLMTAWLSRKGISISSLNPEKNKNRSKSVVKAEKFPEFISDQTFVPIQPHSPSKIQLDGLSGISITFPDGVCITIKQASVSSLTDFINNYNLETL